MAEDSKKVAVIGVGMVGMSFAYAALNQNICDELLLIDINKERAWGEAADLSHGLPFAPSSMKIYSGNYCDCGDMDVVVICAGVPQVGNETRRDLLQKNYEVFKTVVCPVVNSGFNGVFLVASNPVDVMTEVVRGLSGFPHERVIGSGRYIQERFSGNILFARLFYKPEFKKLFNRIIALYAAHVFYLRPCYGLFVSYYRHGFHKRCRKLFFSVHARKLIYPYRIFGSCNKLIIIRKTYYLQTAPFKIKAIYGTLHQITSYIFAYFKESSYVLESYRFSRHKHNRFYYSDLFPFIHALPLKTVIGAYVHS